MLKSPGRRFFVVGFLVLLMFIPLFFAAEVINSRKNYSQGAITSVGQDWGGPQALSGPQLVIPIERTIVQINTRPRLDPVTGIVMTDPETGKELFERFEETILRRDDFVYIYPDSFDVALSTQTTIRNRGIFRVPVYQATADITFDFDPTSAASQLDLNERLLWNLAEIRVAVSNNRALRGETRLISDGQNLPLEPLINQSGFAAPTGDPRDFGTYSLRMGFNGAQSLMVAPVGRESHVTLKGDWPHPSFSGAFLPDGSDISDDGFSATWTIPHLARSLPQVSREDPQSTARRSTIFGLHYIEPNDFYQKAYRAARYGVLFVALTFLTVLLIERGVKRPVHPVQYILIGLVQSVFVLLMVAYAEHLGFGLSYLISAAATVGLLTLYGFIGLKLGQRSLVLGATLVVVYAVLYLILQSADYALLAGATLSFLALALTMVATRNEDWYGPQVEKGPGALARLFGAARPPVPPAPPTASPPPAPSQ